MKKTALITGIAGQDGSYLAELLLEKKYCVYGTVKNKSQIENIAHIYDKITLVDADLSDESSLCSAVKSIWPSEIYNLAAPSFPQASWDNPLAVADVVALGVLRMLESIRKTNPDARFYQAGSSEMFGNANTPVQNENTPFKPRNPYGSAKAYGYWAVINHRENYSLHASNGITFNHESPRRGMEFVTRKISYGVARIYHGLSKEIILGNLDSRRDWGFSGDFVRAMWLMLQNKNPGDYVIATGQTHSVRDVLEIAFNSAGIKNWEPYVKIDKSLVRPAEKCPLCGDSTKARTVLGWKPEVSFKNMIKMMVESDIKLLENRTLKG